MMWMKFLLFTTKIVVLALNWQSVNQTNVFVMSEAHNVMKSAILLKLKVTAQINNQFYS